MIPSLLTFIFLLSLSPGAWGAYPCNPMFFPAGMVCVCTAQYCDTIDPLVVTPAGTVQIYESDRFGNKRFVRRLQSFNGTEDPAGNVWDVTVQRSMLKQEMLGIGGSFSDAATIVIGSLNSESQIRDVYNSYFSENGIEMAVARITISGSDFSVWPYSYDDTPEDINLDNFAFQEEDLMYKIPQIKIAQEVAAHGIKLFGSSWAPPAWMKTNGEINHGGTLRDEAGSAIWQSYANYLTKWVTGYEEAGVDLWGMTVQNEPMTGFSPTFPWNTCGFTSAMERDFIKMHLGPTLDEAGYNTSNFNLMILDHDRNWIQNWTETILTDEDAAKYVAGTAVHWYGNDFVPISIYDEIVEKFGRFILSTEASLGHWEQPIGDAPVGLGSWALAETYMQDIALTTQHSVAGWVDWNMALNMSGGPTWPGVSERSAPIIVSDDGTEFYKMPMFYALGHWSKFVVPGSRNIVLDPAHPGNEDFQVTAFERPDGGVAIVVANMYMQDQVLNLTDPMRGNIKIRVEGKSFNSYLYY